VRAREWYSSSAVTRFRPSHICFILQNISSISEGRYPPPPASGYTDLGTSIQVSPRPGAKFTRVVEISAELTARLNKAGIDGVITLLHYEDGVSLERMAHLLGYIWHRPIGEGAIKRRIHRAIRYCVGEDRREESYYQWRKDGKNASVFKTSSFNH